MTDGALRWNHNNHYHRLILAAVPAAARNALDVGCGEGLLTRQLHDLVPHVVGVDRHGPSIAVARAHPAAREIDYRVPPPLTFRQQRRMALELLPGATFRRLVLWRYSLIWHRPAPVARQGAGS